MVKGSHSNPKWAIESFKSTFTNGNGIFLSTGCRNSLKQFQYNVPSIALTSILLLLPEMTRYPTECL